MIESLFKRHRREPESGGGAFGVDQEVGTRCNEWT